MVSLAQAHPDASIVVIHTASPLGFGSYAGKERQVHADWLTGMKERAEQIGARLVIRSSPGSGTAITVTVPVPPDPQGNSDGH